MRAFIAETFERIWVNAENAESLMKNVFAFRFVLFISASLSPIAAARAGEIYANSFNGPIGTTYPEWTSSPFTYASGVRPLRNGTLPAPEVTNTESPNHARRFLGEFGGPAIGKPGDAGWNRTRVEQTVSLALRDLSTHAALKVASSSSSPSPGTATAPPTAPNAGAWRWLAERHC